MMAMVTTSFLCLLAYVVGSIPSGYLLVRATRRLDVRDYGSHNVGAINVFRVGGLWLGLLTLLADIGKALAIVLLAAAVTPSVWTVASVAFLVMVGHAYSAWFFLQERRFSEGKSAACALGVLVGLGVRQSRYFGRAKTQFQALRAAAVANPPPKSRLSGRVSSLDYS